MNAIINFKEQSMPKFTAHAPSKREELKKQSVPYEPHLPLLSQDLLNYQLKAAAADHNQRVDFFSWEVKKLSTKFTKHLTAQMKRDYGHEEDKAQEMDRVVLFGAVKEIGRVLIQDTRQFMVKDENKRVLRQKLMNLCHDIRKTLIHLE